MKNSTRLTLLTASLLFATGVQSQSIDDKDDAEALRLAAVEALIAAPPERALPLANKILAGGHSNEVKEKALFVLSQIDSPAARQTLLQFAREGELQHEAIRMIGIGGDDATLAVLREIYTAGDSPARKAVLEAYLIADDAQAILEIAASANGEDLEQAIKMLGAMGAHEGLRELRSSKGVSQALIQAYAISGDLQALRDMVASNEGPELLQAIEAIGIVGGAEAGPLLVEVYRGAQTDDVREAALDGLLVAGKDDAVLELYRAAESNAEKKKLLKRLIMMGSDEVWEAIDTVLDETQ